MTNFFIRFLIFPLQPDRSHIDFIELANAPVLISINYHPISLAMSRFGFSINFQTAELSAVMSSLDRFLFGIFFTKYKTHIPSDENFSAVNFPL